MTRNRLIFTARAGFAAILCLSSGVLLAAEENLPWGYPESKSTSGKRADETIVEGKNPSIPIQLALPSPDGCYAITWPTREYGDNLDGKLDNILADLKAGKPIHRIDTKKDGDYDGRRWGGLDGVWRKDSRAVILFYHAKWGPRAVRALVIGEDGKVSDDDLTAPVRQELLKVFKAQAAKFTEGLDAESFGAEIGCEFSADGKTAELMARGETNSKFIDGEPRVVAELVATFDLATHQLSTKSGKVTEAKIQKNE